MGLGFNFLRVTADELDAMRKDSKVLQQKVFTAKPDPKHSDIDKSWEAILFILTGQNHEQLNHPLGAALFSGQIVDPTLDMGYGPAHYLTPEQVSSINQQIAVISDDEVKARYDPAKMMELHIYPQIWDQQNDELFDYVLEYFQEMRTIYSVAATEGEAMVTFMS
jgi:hypothetical protein